ncbi:MAG: hypothetical protein AB7I30_05370 [Isosphaeraceae bacterium]
MRLTPALLLLVLGSTRPEVARAEGAAQAMVARLRASCEARHELRGVMVRAGTLNQGTLELAGTLDDPETQAPLLEAEAARILKEEPTWRAEIPAGVTAKGMARFALRSGILPRLQASFADAPDDLDGSPGLLAQTRLDDLYFDREGRLRLVGLCVNQRAFLSRNKPNAKSDADPRQEIAQGMRDRLRNEPIPTGVDPQVFAGLQTDEVRFEEDPARPAQRAAIQNPTIDACLLLDGRFDAQGRLVLSGYLNPEARSPGPAREAVKALLTAPEFAKTYERPRGNPSEDAETAIARLRKYDWRPGLHQEVQSRCAQAARPGAERSYRHCRIDRVVFDYGDAGELILRFEGLSLAESEHTALPPDLREWCRQRFRFDRLVAYDLDLDFKSPKRPLEVIVSEIQREVAENPELDGIRIDDLTFGPRRETELVGVSPVTPPPEALARIATPSLKRGLGDDAEALGVASRMSLLPTTGLLRELRGLVANDSNLDETSLDRLYFQPIDELGRPELTLEVATLRDFQERARAALERWLETSDLARQPGMKPTVTFPANRKESVRESLWKLVYSDAALDGVRVDRVRFDAENQLSLICAQEFQGQLDQALVRQKLLEKYANAAATAWRGSPAPAPRIEPGATYSLKALLASAQEKLPMFKEFDGVLFRRINWASNTKVVFHGYRCRKVDEKALQERILTLNGGYGSVAFDLVDVKPDPELNRRQLLNAMIALRDGGIAAYEPHQIDELVFYDPEDSVAWYVRAAYHHAKGNGSLARRDMDRALSIEGQDRTGNLASQRRRRLSTIKGPLKDALDKLEEKSYGARVAR